MKTHWIYEGKTATTPDKDKEGFVYLITNEKTGMKYIGRKAYFKRVKKKKTTESNWRTYTGSSIALNKDIKELGIKNFSFKILDECMMRSELNLLEVEYQVYHNVVRDITFYNQVVANSKIGYGMKDKMYSDEMKRRITEALKS